MRLAMVTIMIGLPFALTRPTLAAAFDRVAAFHEIARTVAAHFVDPDLRGLDWDAVTRRYAGRVDTTQSLEEFAVVVNEMLGLLDTSHTRLYTSREPAYYQLLSIFEGTLDEAIREAHPDNPQLCYPGIGVFTRSIDGSIFVSGVLESGPADDAGLHVGDRIISVEGAPFRPIGSFEGRVDRPTSIVIQRTADRTDRLVINVRPALIDPGRLFLDAMERSVTIIERSAAGIGYVHLWSFAGPEYQELLRSEIAFGRLRDADALIIDLRGGWGGANPSDLNLFNRRVPVMTHVLRDGERREIDFQWRKPVALLVDGGSRSGKEIFAYGFKKHGLGPVVGARTAGAVSGGRPFLVRPGILLYLAVLDVLVDGERLEGRGVSPDIEVPFELPFAGGVDPQLEAAVAALAAPGS